MAVASPALPLVSSDPQTFEFAPRPSALIQVRFYTTATGDVGSEIAASAGGIRTLVVNTETDSVATYAVSDDDPSREYQATDVPSAIDNQTKICNGATWYEFAFGPGLRNCNVTASGGSDPAGAMSYRIWVNVEAARKPV